MGKSLCIYNENLINKSNFQVHTSLEKVTNLEILLSPMPNEFLVSRESLIQQVNHYKQQEMDHRHVTTQTSYPGHNNNNYIHGQGNYNYGYNYNSNSNGTSAQGVVVSGEEIGIVLVVLILWVGAIILFFNRWGKIRMLEPYQPKFCEHHNPVT